MVTYSGNLESGQNPCYHPDLAFLFQTPEKKQSEPRGRKRKPDIQSESSQGDFLFILSVIQCFSLLIFLTFVTFIFTGKLNVRGPKISDYFDVSTFLCIFGSGAFIFDHYLP